MTLSHDQELTWSISQVDRFFHETLMAQPIPYTHPILQPYLLDPFIPPRAEICAIYVLYNEAVLGLLNGEIEHVHGLHYQQALRKSPKLTDLETILDIGSLVVLSNASIGYSCYIGGSIEKLYALVTYFSGKAGSDSDRDYFHAKKIVERMGLA